MSCEQSCYRSARQPERSVSRRLISVLRLVAVAWWPASAAAQMEFDREPINYSTAARSDPIAKLQTRLASGQTKLDFEDHAGYPCSYLIHSEAFAALPEPVKSHVYRRLWRILTN